VVNTRAYNEALRQRGSLTVWVTGEAIAGWPAARRQCRGGQAVYSELAILTALTLRLVFKLGPRQTQGLMRSMFGLLELDRSGRTGLFDAEPALEDSLRSSTSPLQCRSTASAD